MEKQGIQMPNDTDVNRVIHEPSRLRIMMILSGVDEVDFKFLLTTLGMTKGNLSSHMERLESAQYVEIIKGFNGKLTHTRYQLTPLGRKSLEDYWREIDAIRNLTQPG